MVAEDDHERDAAFRDGSKQRAQRIFAVFRAVAKAKHGAWALQLIAKQHDQIGGIILERMRFTADDELCRKLRIL